MFSFFKKKTNPAPEPAEPATSAPQGAVPVEPLTSDEPPAAAAGVEVKGETPAEERSWLDRLRGWTGVGPAESAPASSVPAAPSADLSAGGSEREAESERVASPAPARVPDAIGNEGGNAASAPTAAAVATDIGFPGGSATATPDASAETVRRSWLDKLRGGLRKTGSSITQVFVGARIDEALYEELEGALLMADAGVKATEFLLSDLKWRVKDAGVTDVAAVKGLLADAIARLLRPLEQPLVVGEHTPTVIMVVGVNGAGKTTTIGKLTRHLAESQQRVLLAAADTFRAAAREQLAVWAGRNRVEIVSQEGGDPAAVTFDAVIAGKARGCDVVIADTAGRLTTQAHLMEELKKIHRVIGKAQAGAPHEVLLVVDGNTGQNALSQVQAFDAALGLTGLVVTKLDGTAKGGVLAAIALWSRERVRHGQRGVPVYFIGVGEKLEDLQTFNAREFAQALLT